MGRYCDLCKRDVQPVKRFSWVAFLVLCPVIMLLSTPFFVAAGVVGITQAQAGASAVGWIGGLMLFAPAWYLLYYALAKKPQCPICANKALTEGPSGTQA